MRRLFVVGLVVLTACGGAVAGQTDTSAKSADRATTAPVTPTTEDGDESLAGTTAPDAPSTTTSDRPHAPDFTLELGDGGSYTLSDAAKPVYLVFWAEW